MIYCRARSLSILTVTGSIHCFINFWIFKGHCRLTQWTSNFAEVVKCTVWMQSTWTIKLWVLSEVWTWFPKSRPNIFVLLKKSKHAEVNISNFIYQLSCHFVSTMLRSLLKYLCNINHKILLQVSSTTLYISAIAHFPWCVLK